MNSVMITSGGEFTPTLPEDGSKWFLNCGLLDADTIVKINLPLPVAVNIGVDIVIVTEEAEVQIIPQDGALISHDNLSLRAVDGPSIMVFSVVPYKGGAQYLMNATGIVVPQTYMNPNGYWSDAQPWDDFNIWNDEEIR